MDENTKNINKDDILKHTSNLIDLVEKAYKTGTATHKVEQDIFTELLKMGHMLLAYLFDLYQGGEQGETIELSDGRKVKRLSMKHKRSYLSIFGEFNLSRWVYGTREGQKIDCIPMDKLLQLPSSKYSYLLQDWGQSLVVSVPLFAMILAATMLGFYTSEVDFTIIAAELYSLAENPMLLALPLSAFVGYILSESKTSERLLRLTHAFFGWMPTGLAIVSLVIYAVLLLLQVLRALLLLL